ncbi:BREX-6 system phosphatase PglZ [Bremerella sp.]|uniref:BREX-6 system phosphatase PglZ n=1 Tax=Bremerella sp. TaxID=2795602 RepID=UPI00391C05D9
MNEIASPIISLGLVAKSLESEIRRLIQQKGIVVWLDAGGTYSDFVDRLTELNESGDLPYAVKAFRGSHLQLMFDLKMLGSGSSRHPLLIHMPGFNSDSVKQTPILELYLAGRRFEKRLKTLVTETATGRVSPDQINAFLESGDVTLADADQWLADVLRSGGSSMLSELQSLSPQALLDDLIAGGRRAGSIAARVDDGQDPGPVWTRAAAMLGMPDVWWRDLLSESQDLRSDDLALAIAGWAMAVEYVDDLERKPVDEHLSVAVKLAKPLKEACCGLLIHLRARHSKFYGTTADEIENFLDAERSSATAEDLGKIDTFRFEEERILDGTLSALENRQWKQAAAWASRRIEGESFWLRDQPERKSVWQLLLAAAQLGCAVDQAGSTMGSVHSHEDAINAYVSRGATVDRAHRHLEQLRRSLLYPSLPKFAQVRERLNELREVWRDWADAWAIDFGTVCSSQGFLPPPKYRQRDFFDQVVVPLCQGDESVAVFAVDAFRFEMATELFAEIESARATTAHLNARLAELPTVTSVGMNALAPVNHNGKMRPKVKGSNIQGFHTGQFQVKDPETRKRAMHERVGGRTCPILTLEEIGQLETKQLRRKIAGAKVVYVHSQVIDDAGEKDLGPVVFEYAMQNIRAAWQLLREAGIKQFVITADHGFLLKDGVSEVQSHGRKVDPRRRHILRPPSAHHPGEQHVPLSDLGYEDCEEHLMFPKTTAAFDIGDKSLNYLHGGNSLQERLIPVVTISHRVALGGQSQQYQFTSVQRLEPVAGWHCVSATLKLASEQAGLGFEEDLQMAVGLRVVEYSDVTLELCDVRGDAKLRSGAIVAKVGSPFEVFFRLTGDKDSRVQVQFYHPAAEADVSPAVVPDRFTVTVIGRSTQEVDKPKDSPTVTDVIPEGSWLNEFQDDGIRRFFNHLEKHGTVTDEESQTLLGSPRKARRFAAQFESYAARAPFEARIDVVGNVKRYVREQKAEYKTLKESKES